MSKEDCIEVQGIIVETLPSTQFKVQIKDQKMPHSPIIHAHIGGKMRMNYIRIIPGDMVTVQISPYDLTRGRITYRHK
jgi:translation initiation factor IF-1